MSSSSVLPSFHDRQTLDLLEQANSSFLGGRQIGRQRSLESESGGESGKVEEDVSDLCRKKRRESQRDATREEKEEDVPVLVFLG